MVKCSCCGNVMKEYAAVAYSVDYLEGYLQGYFGKPFFDLINNNIKTHKQRVIKHICIAIIYKYSNLKEKDVQRRYSMDVENLQRYYWDFKSRLSNNLDFNFLCSQLSPSAIINKQKLKEAI